MCLRMTRPLPRELNSVSTSVYEKSLRLEDWTGQGVPPAGYGLGGISGAPLLVPEFGRAGWYFRLAGVVSEAPGPREPDAVIFEMVIAERAEFIQPDGTLAKAL